MYSLNNNILSLNNKPIYGYGATPPPVEVTLFEMTYNNTLVPTINNTVGNITFSRLGLSSVGFESVLKYEGVASYHGRSWQNGDYWQWLVNTTGYQNLTFSFYSLVYSTTFIGAFDVRVSPNGTNWTTVLATFSYAAPSTWYYKLSDIFPASCNNNATTYIRINKINDSSSIAIYHIIDVVKLNGFII